MSSENNQYINTTTSQFGEDVFVYNYFRNKKEGFYVDAGAFHPERYSNTYLLWKINNWKGINIDASEESITNFNERRIYDININMPLDSVSGREVEFVHYRGKAHSTIDEKQKNINKNIEKLYQKKMKTTTLNDILTLFLKSETRIDFLNIDIEGKDFDVAENFNWQIWQPELVCIEDHEFVKLLNKKGFTRIFDLMISNEYMFCAQYGVTSIYKRNFK